MIAKATRAIVRVADGKLRSAQELLGEARDLLRAAASECVGLSQTQLEAAVSACIAARSETTTALEVAIRAGGAP